MASREQTSTLRLRLRWSVTRAFQALGFLSILVGAYPIYRPVVAYFLSVPAAADEFVSGFGIPLAIIDAPGAAAPSAVFIGIGMAIVWLSTSHRV